MSVSAKDRLKVATTGAATEFTPTYNPKPHVQNAAFKAPGRLGEPKMELEDEPRVNAALLPTLKNFQSMSILHPAVSPIRPPPWEKGLAFIELLIISTNLF